MNADIISEVVRKLIGEIEPCGDSAIDRERRTNLHTLIHVMDVLLDDVCEITTQRDRKEGSICQMVDMAEDAIIDWHDLIEDYIGVNSAYTQPIVEPERKKGHWIYIDDDDGRYDTYRCSECHNEITVDAYRVDDIGFTIDDICFCNKCGAEMNGGCENGAN